MKQSLLVILLVFITTTSFAQKVTHEENLQVNGSSKSVFLIYKIKKSKEGKNVLQVKFKNKTKVPINVDAELGLYDNGVLEERATISDCLEKSFFSNLFRPVHIISSDVLEKENMNIEFMEMKLTQTDECPKTDS